MTELKTLKDLRKFNWNNEEYENMDISNEEYSKGKRANLLREEAITTKELKAEAIKWVKFAKKKKLEYDNGDYVDWLGFDDPQPGKDAWEQCDGLIKSFKHFFRITEEDLK